jgi:hypothetical protein
MSVGKFLENPSTGDKMDNHYCRWVMFRFFGSSDTASIYFPTGEGGKNYCL